MTPAQQYLLDQFERRWRDYKSPQDMSARAAPHEAHWCSICDSSGILQARDSTSYAVWEHRLDLVPEL